MIFHSRITRILSLVALLAGSARHAVAQADTTRDGRTIVPRDTAHSERHRSLFTNRDALLATSFVVLTVAMFPLDKQIAQHLQDSSLRANRFFDRSARDVEFITSPGSFIIGGGIYAVGRLSGSANLADLGWHGTEAVLLGSGITGILKGALGRARPYVAGDTNPRDFQAFRGFGQGTKLKNYGDGDYQSFPSGHTTTAFAAAASVTSEMRRLYPGSVKFVAPALYGGATLVGLSRMYHNNHWASDVALGAAIGTFSGLKVVRYSHARPNNRLDHFILGLTVTPNADGGGALALSLPLP